MAKSINPMFSFTIRGEAPFGSAPSLIVLMSLQPPIPRQVALLQRLPPLHYAPSTSRNCKPPLDQGWGIFNRQNEEFSTGVDTSLNSINPPAIANRSGPTFYERALRTPKTDCPAMRDADLFD